MLASNLRVFLCERVCLPQHVLMRTRCTLFQIRDLEAEFEAEQRREREAQANARKIERQYKELLALMEDDKRHLAELTSLNDSMNIKIKTYKRQIDEAVRRIAARYLIYLYWYFVNFVNEIWRQYSGYLL